LVFLEDPVGDFLGGIGFRVRLASHLGSYSGVG